MKIKASIDRHHKMMDLINMVTSLSKYGDRLVFIARKESLTLTLTSDTTRSYVWYDINCSSFFCRYVFEGVDPTSPDTDMILVEVNCEYLISALNGAKAAASFLEIKLEKKEFPCLAIHIIIPAGDDKTRTNACHVPVIILPRSVFDDYALPYGTIAFEVVANCPRFSMLKKFINIFKNGKVIRITLTDDNSLTIQANEDTCEHYSIFDNIGVRVYGDNNDVAYKGRDRSCNVEQKKIAQWIHSITFPHPPRLQCMIKDSEYLKLFFRIRDEIMASFVTPAVYTGDDCSDEEEVNYSGDEV